MTPAPTENSRAPIRRPRRDDRGSDSVEMAILLPAILLVLAVLVVGARIALASDRISGVAGIAARDASLARTPATATQAATTSAQQALTSAGFHCADVRVSVDTSQFTHPPGQAAAVTVNVWCTLDLSDLALPGLPGSRVLHDSARSPLDPARDPS